jgi:hypothetical protein
MDRQGYTFCFAPYIREALICLSTSKRLFFRKGMIGLVGCLLRSHVVWISKHTTSHLTTISSIGSARPPIYPREAFFLLCCLFGAAVTAGWDWPGLAQREGGGLLRSKLRHRVFGHGRAQHNAGQPITHAPSHCMRSAAAYSIMSSILRITSHPHHIVSHYLHPLD